MENNKLDKLLSDPLSEVTRKERRALLGVSMVGIALVHMHIVPTKISSLGIEFSNTDSPVLFKVTGLIVLYFIGAFILYGVTDFMRWMNAVKSTQVKAIEEARKQVETDSQKTPIERSGIFIGTDSSDHARFMILSSKLKKHSNSIKQLDKLSTPATYFRALFEFILPVLVGFYSVWILFFYSG